MGTITSYATERYNHFCYTKLTNHRTAAHLGMIPLVLVTSSLDTLAGVAFGALSILTCGRDRSLFQKTINHLDMAKTLIAVPYKHLLNAIHSYSFPNTWHDYPREEMSRYQCYFDVDYDTRPFLSQKGAGLFTTPILKKGGAQAERFRDSGNILKQHIFSRLTYALMAAACVITRVVDGIIGIIGGTFALLTLGRIKKLNVTAKMGLHAPSLICDLFYCTIKFINPWAEGTVIDS